MRFAFLRLQRAGADTGRFLAEIVKPVAGDRRRRPPCAKIVAAA